MNLKLYAIYLLCTQFAFGKTTRREYSLLSRKRRYLLFPTGANFVYQVVNVKVLMKTVPKGVQFLNEWDTPFPLPTNLKEFRDFRKERFRRGLLDNFGDSLDRYGLNGTACVNRMICEAREFIPMKGKSLIKDMLYAVFSIPEGEEDNYGKNRQDICHDSNFKECTAPLLHIMLESLNNY